MNNIIINLKASVLPVQSGLEMLRQGKTLNRKAVVEALTRPSIELDPILIRIKTNVYKSYPEILELKSNLKALAKTCLSLSIAVTEKKIKPQQLMIQLDTVCAEFESEVKRVDSILNYLQPDKVIATNSTDLVEEVDSKQSRKDQREDAATAKTGKVLEQMRSRYAHKVPKKLSALVQFVELPIMARFKTFSMNAESLSKMGFKVHAAGLHSTPSSDLGIIIEHQLLLFFRKSDARNCAEEAAKIAKESDGVLMHRKQLQKDRNAHRREIKALQLLLDSTKSEKRKALLQEQIASEQARIDTITTTLDNRIDSFKQATSVGRVRRQMKVSNDHAILDYINPILDSINSKSSSDYGLFTTMPLNGVMSDSDVCAVWLMPTSAIRLLMNHTGGDQKLQTWFLPWTNG